MKNRNPIATGCILLILTALLFGTSGCGESNSTPDRSTNVEPQASVTPSSVTNELPPPPASTAPESTNATTVRGELVKIEEEQYVAKDLEGAEHVFKSSPDTLIDQGMTVGDRIIVKIGKDGNTVAIRKDR